MGRRNRQREKPAAPTAEYGDPDGGVLVLRGAMSPATRRGYAEVLRGGLNREDAWQRAVEFLFERLAVSWTISGLPITRQRDLLARYRMASTQERRLVREALRAHLAEHFPDVEAP